MSSTSSVLYLHTTSARQSRPLSFADSIARWVLAFHPRASRCSTLFTSSAAGTQSHLKPEPLPDKMQVAVAIAMPQQLDAGCSSRKVEERNDGTFRREHGAVSVPELCLGLTEVRGTGTAEWSNLSSVSQVFRDSKELEV